MGSAVANRPRSVALYPNRVVRERNAGCGLSALLLRIEVMLSFVSGSYEPGPGVCCSEESLSDHKWRQTKRVGLEGMDTLSMAAGSRARAPACVRARTTWNVLLLGLLCE